MLTAKQQAFAEYVANGDTLPVAYRKAYDAKNSKDSTVAVNASKVGKIQAVRDEIERIKFQRQEVNKLANTRDKAYKINYIWERIEECKKNGDYSNVARFMDILNRMEAHYTDATQKDDTKPLSALSDDELKKLLEAPLQ